jgi:hypothetical protein
MKYLCLVYTEEKLLDAMPKDEFEAFSDEHVALDEELKKSGHSILAEALQPVRTATTVRVRNGRLSTTDGPFAETKEQLMGLYVIDCADREEALAAARRLDFKSGVLEVRAIASCGRGVLSE